MSGVLHGVLASLKAAAAAVTDAYFKYVSLLLNTTSTNGAQNNTFLDASTNNFTITRNGNTTQGSFTPYMPNGYWGAYFDGTLDYLSVPRNNAFLPIANEDFTIEAWVYLTATPTFPVIGAQIAGLGEYGLDSDWVFGITSSLQASFYINALTTSFTNTTPLTLNTWNHVAASRSGTGTNNLTVYVNGVGQSFTTNSTTVGTGLRNLTIGADQNGDEANFSGYISNLRLVKGTAVYTGNFTPPTTPLTAITNTSLLACQSNRFIDNSTNAFAITVNGDSRISKFSPFSPPASYSTATYGGSGYFDGTGDYLSIADNAALNMGSSDFTIESWVYTNSGVVGAIVDKDGTSAISWSQYLLYITAGGKFEAIISTTTTSSPPVNPSARLTGTTTVQVGTWYHVAVTRVGVNATLWVNGVSEATSSTVPATLNTRNQPATVGTSNNAGAGASFVNGYLSNTRIVKGTAVYTANFTPPTSPVTAITNTSLLLNCTNGGIYDAATINDAETVGNAQVSTTQVKFGSTSINFDGTGDWLTVLDKPELRFGTGAFTIEFWVYRLALGVHGLVSKRNATPIGWYVGCTASHTLQFIADATVITSTGALLGGQWYHVAVVREGTGVNQTKLYIDGVSSGTGTIANNFTNTDVLFVGADQSGVSAFFGYIDELRITNGVARYTSNFTPPTAAFPTQ